MARPRATCAFSAETVALKWPFGNSRCGRACFQKPMPVTLESIAFNHDPSGKATGAFYIRRNETEPVVLPEWEKCRCTAPDSSPVAYAIHRVPQFITIKASFSATARPSQPVWIQAVAIQKVDPCDGDQSLLPFNILGDTDAVDVTFVNGKANDVPFHVSSEQISNAGASASDQLWHWQWSFDKSTWTSFQTTQHRVYVVPKLPTCPWEPKSDSASNIQVPWTEALEYACHWAAGVTKNIDLAARMVTNRVYSLGKVLIRWGQSPKYANKEFALTEFLALLRNGIGRGQSLNCDDCAAVVSTFANLLGAKLWQSSMGGDSFWTNHILLIGHSHWRRVGFGHHSVAWKGNCSASDKLFDACLQIDGDRKPNIPPQFPKQPVNIRFGTRSDGGYQHSLVLKGKCLPIPDDPTYGRQLRKFGLGVLADKAIQTSAPLARVMKLYRCDPWPIAELRLNVTAIASKSFADKLRFMGWTLHLEEPEYFQLDERVDVLHTILKTDESIPTQLIDLSIYQCANNIDPNEILLRVLSCFESLLERSHDPHPGDLAFADGEGNVVFRRERFVGAVRSIGREGVNAVPVAMMLDDLLKS